LRVNRVNVVGLGSTIGHVHVQFYILDRPNHPTADHEHSIDTAVFNLATKINQGKVLLDLGALLGVTARFIGIVKQR